MIDDKHPLDEAAEQMQAAAEKPVADLAPSPDYWEFKTAEDDSVGTFPQAEPVVEAKRGQPGHQSCVDSFGFPDLPDGLPAQKLKRPAKWTDALSLYVWRDGYLLNEAALQVFRQVNLGNYREYPTTVTGGKHDERAYTLVYVDNSIPPEALDFERSEFYVQDMISIPIAPIEIDSYEEWLAATKQARNGELEGGEKFSRIGYKRLYFRQGQSPNVDLFHLGRLGIRKYISSRFRRAINESGISGLLIKPNRRLFNS
ncbi:MAG: hypothetical protein HUU46_20710 [Candidatus Hydrogenedentes bacterium]|nr:hypothetical protein [Candidatus Hydrogenedentota bacterium]